MCEMVKSHPKTTAWLVIVAFDYSHKSIYLKSRVRFRMRVCRIIHRVISLFQELKIKTPYCACLCIFGGSHTIEGAKSCWKNGLAPETTAWLVIVASDCSQSTYIQAYIHKYFSWKHLSHHTLRCTFTLLYTMCFSSFDSQRLDCVSFSSRFFSLWIDVRKRRTRLFG